MPKSMSWPIGSPVRFPYNSTVLSVVGKGQVLIRNQRYRITVVAHIHGLENDFIDGQDFLSYRTLYIYTGTFVYTSTLGTRRTVPSLAIYKPLTKEQFANCLNSGFKLYQITKRRDRIERKLIP